MNKDLRNILVFTLASVVGYIVPSLVLVSATRLGLLEGLPRGEQVGDFMKWYLTGAVIVWICSIVAGLFGFRAGALQKFLLSAPCAIPAVYCIIILIAFSGFQG